MKFVQKFGILLFLCSSLTGVFSKSKKDVSKPKEDILTGSILEEKTKKPIAGAVIEIKNRNLGLGYYKVQSDKNGDFVVRDFIKQIDYEVEIVSEGYVSHKGNIGLNKNIYYLQKESIVFGRVLDSNQKPIVDVEVQATDYYWYYGENTNKATTVKTDKNGEYKIPKLRSTSYNLSFTKFGFISETAVTQNIKPGEKFRVPMILHKPASLTGRLTIAGLEEDTPARNVQIQLVGNRTYSHFSYDNGFYQIDDLKPGKYKLSYIHRGFETRVEENLEIEEGISIKDHNKSLKPLDPFASIFTYNYTFPIGGKVSFTLKTFRLDKVDVTIYKVPEKANLELPSDPNSLDFTKYNFEKVISWEEPVKNFQPYEWKAEELELKDNLPLGSYCIEVKGLGKLVNRKFFTVTRVGIVVKRSPSSILVYAIDLVTNQIIPNAKLEFLEKRNREESPHPDPVDENPEKKYNIENSDPEENDGLGDELGKIFPSKSIFSIHSMLLSQAKEEVTKDPNISYDQLTGTYLKRIQTGFTNEEGIYHEKFENKNLIYVYVNLPDGSFAIANSGATVSTEQEVNKYFIYTDRPVYKNGHKVFFKVIAKERKDKFLPSSVKLGQFAVVNSYNNIVIKKGVLEFDEWGTSNGFFDIPMEVAMGEYRIDLFPPSEGQKIEENTSEDLLISGDSPGITPLGSGSFHIERYRKPEYKVDISPLQKFYLNGQEVKFKVEGKYFFGGAMATSQVTYRIYQKKLQQLEDKYWWENDYNSDSYSYNNKLLKEGITNLDENGIAILSLAPTDLPFDREITVEVSVVDKSNVAVDRNASVIVGRGEYYIKIRPELEFYSTKEKKKIFIETMNHVYEPVSAEVNLLIYRNIWKPWQRVYGHDGKAFFELKVRTDKEGKYTLELEKELEIAGEFDIVAKAVDSKNNIISSSKNLFIYEQGKKIDTQYKNLELVVNKNQLEKEEEITVLLKSKFTGLPVLLTIEGKDIHYKKIVQMENNVESLKILIPSTFAPNFEIVATLHKNRGVYSTKQEIFIPYKDTMLTYAITKDKEKYYPGEEATVKILVKDENGSPIEADLSVGVVDEAIYKIREDSTPAMKTFFYTNISNWVTTNLSFPITLLAGSAKDGNIREQVRKDFRDTAYWNAKLKTDKNGIAKFSFKMPDNLTTWRLTLRGHDLVGRLGETRDYLLCTQELVGRISKPRFFVEKDTIKIGGLVNNNSKEGISGIQTKMEMDKKKLNPLHREKISLPANGSAREDYEIEVPENKDTIKFKYSVFSEKYKDSLEEKVSVETKGNPYSLTRSGDTKEDSSLNISLNREEGKLKPRELEFRIYPGSVSRILSSVEYLDNYPYGCTEQNINKFLPALEINSIWKQKTGNVLLPENKLKSHAKAALHSIQTNQNSDGTWGFWNGDRGNEFLTGYVMEACYRLQDLGYPVNPTILANGREAMQRIQTNPQYTEIDKKAYLFYVDSLHSLSDKVGSINWALYEKIKSYPKPNAYQIAYLLRTIVWLELRENAQEQILEESSGNQKLEKKLESNLTKIENEKDILLKKLISLKKKDSLGTYFDNGANNNWSWQGGRAEISALVLLALLEADTNSGLQGELITSLYRRSQNGHWRSTKETAMVLSAINAYISKNGVPKESKGNVQFVIDKKEKISIEYDTSKPGYGMKKNINWNSPNDSLQLEAKASSRNSIPFDLIVKGGIELANRKKDKTTNIFSIQRSFYSVSRIKDQNKQEFMVPEKWNTKNPLQKGQEIMVKIKFTSKQQLENVLLEDYLPSGFEIAKEDLYSKADHSYLEKRDEKIMFYFETVKPGKVYEVAFLLRAELAGKFRVRASRVECMYDPEVGDFALPDTLVVKD